MICVGPWPLIISNVKSSGELSSSASVAVIVIEIVSPSLPASFSVESVVIGASLTGVIVIVAVAVFESKLLGSIVDSPSLALYVKLSDVVSLPS